MKKNVLLASLGVAAFVTVGCASSKPAEGSCGGEKKPEGSCGAKPKG